MMTLQQIRDALQDRNLSEVARRTGLSKQLLHKIKTGATKEPRYETVRVLVGYLGG